MSDITRRARNTPPQTHRMGHRTGREIEGDLRMGQPKRKQGGSMKISRRRLNNLRRAVKEYRAGAREVFEASEVFRIADAQWAVDAHKGMARLTIRWINPREERDGYVIERVVDPFMREDAEYQGRVDMQKRELHIKAQYDRYIRTRFMDDVHKIREHLAGRWPSVRISSSELDALMKGVFGK